MTSLLSADNLQRMGQQPADTDAGNANANQIMTGLVTIQKNAERLKTPDSPDQH